MIHPIPYLHAMFNIFIVEDEPLAAEKLHLFLKRMDKIGSIRIFHDGIAALCAWEEEKPDILFLDIEMPGISGIEFMEKVGNTAPSQIIITSAYEKYALPSFNFNVADYLLKPYTFPRLKQAFDKACENIRLRALDERDKRQNITVRTEGRTEIISPADILVIEAVKDYVRIIATDKKMMIHTTLTSFETMLPKENFIRVHRSFIINRNHVTGYDKNSTVLDNRITIAIGKTYREQFENLMQANSPKHKN